MFRIERYLIRECLAPAALGFAIYSFLLTLQLLLKSADLLFSTDVTFSVLVDLILYSFPSTLVLVIPVSFLVGILLGVGRLAVDAELIALSASGLGNSRLMRPIVLLGAAASLVCLHITTTVLPFSNSRLTDLRVKILSKTVTEEIEERKPFVGIKGKIIIILDTFEKEWRGVLIASESLENNETTFARSARPDFDDVAKRFRINLENSSTHTTNLLKPAQYHILNQEIGDASWADQGTTRGTASIKRGLRESTLKDLRARMKDQSQAEEAQSLAAIEFHKRLGFPAACLAFAFIGLPLAAVTSRSGKSSGFAVSILVVFAYYVVFNFGEEAARSGVISPILAVWAPNLLVGTLGLALLRRKENHSSIGRPPLLILFGRLVGELWKRIAPRDSSSGSALKTGDDRLLIRLPFASTKILGHVDSYLAKIFLRVFSLTLLSCVGLYLIADFTENVDDILKNSVPPWVAIQYYTLRSFAVFFEVMPLVVLIAVLLFAVALARSNELTAFKALGISIFRIGLPIFLLITALSIVSSWLNSEVLPNAHRLERNLLASIKARPVDKSSPERRWIVGRTGNSVLGYSSLDASTRQIANLQLFTFSDTFELTSRVFATRARQLEGHSWLIEGWWARFYEGGKETRFVVDQPSARIDVGYSIDELQEDVRIAKEMDFSELSSYISEIRGFGRDVANLQLALTKRIAYPFLVCSMAILALPFGFRFGKEGLYTSLGIAIVLGMMLLLLTGILEAMALNGRFPLILASWTPPALFTVFGLYVFLGIRT